MESETVVEGQGNKLDLAGSGQRSVKQILMTFKLECQLLMSLALTC